jgi:uncharacterized protein
MNVLADISHPAHVHFFRNFINIMKQRGHTLNVVARKKSITYNLLRAYNIDFIEFGKSYKSKAGKLFGLICFTFKLIFICKKYRINMIVDSGAGLYPALVARVLKIYNISFNNTDVFFLLKYIKNFPSSWVTPASYKIDLGKNHIRCDVFNELAFLHPKYFHPDKTVLNRLGIDLGEKYILLRFVQWIAIEETNYSGYTLDEIRETVDIFKDFGKVFISCEYKLPKDLLSYQIEYMDSIKFGDMQSIEYYSSLVFGESGAMASEAAMLGRPAFFVSPKALGFIEELEKKYGLLFIYQDKKKALDVAVSLLKDQDIMKKWNRKKQHMLNQKINYTDFMIWYVEEFPQSLKIMQKKPDYQFTFK